LKSQLETAIRTLKDIFIVQTYQIQRGSDSLISNNSWCNIGRQKEGGKMIMMVFGNQNPNMPAGA
jgi:hypothetical protein